MNKGFTALIIVIGISTLLLALATSSALENGMFFDMAMKKYYRVLNYYNALNCLDQAILKIAHDAFIEVHTPISISNLSCSIISIIHEDMNTLSIISRGDYLGIYVYRKARVSISTHSLSIISSD